MKTKNSCKTKRQKRSATPQNTAKNTITMYLWKNRRSVNRIGNENAQIFQKPRFPEKTGYSCFEAGFGV